MPVDGIDEKIRRLPLEQKAKKDDLEKAKTEVAKSLVKGGTMQVLART